MQRAAELGETLFFPLPCCNSILSAQQGRSIHTVQYVRHELQITAEASTAQEELFTDESGWARKTRESKNR